MSRMNLFDSTYPEGFDGMSHFQRGMYFIIFAPIVSVFL